NTALYRELPVPRSQCVHFKRYDLSVMICSYKRVKNIRHILSQLVRQTYSGTFEVIVWNNNIEAFGEVEGIRGEFKELLDLKVIHSSENFYCVVRLSMSHLMRSDLLMVCDDDVEPSPEYLETFVRKYCQYGPDAVLCARGHVFFPHAVSE